MEQPVEAQPAAGSQSEVTVREAWCKGCYFCVEFCPKDVLSLEGNVAVVVRPERCNGCSLCVWVCPDFAIEVK